MEEVSDSPTKCNKCGRLLLLKSSVERGQGPVCFKKSQTMAVLEAMREDAPLLTLEPVY